MINKTTKPGAIRALFRYLQSLLSIKRTGSRSHRFSVYIFAVVATVVTLIIYYALGVAVEGRLSAILFVLPIVISAYLGGLGPGVVSTLLSAVFLVYFVIPPTYSFKIVKNLNLSQLLILISNGVLVSFLIEVLHRSRAYAEKRTHDFLAANEKLEAEVTERKRAEEALQERERKLTSIFRAASVGIGLVANRCLIDVNETLCRMTGYSRKELLGKSARMLYLNDEEFDYVGREKYRQIAEQETGKVETRWMRKDGSIIDIILSSTPLDWKDLSKGVTFTALDITERIQAERELRNSLKEKEILLHEVHHRVKNNLQVISSLIILQSDHITDKYALELLRECQNRIKSMALVHEELYRTKDFAALDLSGYVNGLVSSLFQSYAVDKAQVTLEIAAEKIPLEPDVAIPCGMIINELVSNSLKHAFPSGRVGTIRVEVRESADRLVIISVADNGVGLPAALEPGETGTLGLQLVFMLAEQLHGKVAIMRNEGTEFRVVFKKQPPDQELS